jgi:hypothetical protein
LVLIFANSNRNQQQQTAKQTAENFKLKRHLLQGRS